MAHQNRRSLDDLLADMLDAGLDAEQQAALNVLLLDDAEARRRYREITALHALLYWKAERAPRPLAEDRTQEDLPAETSFPPLTLPTPAAVTAPPRAARFSRKINWRRRPAYFLGVVAVIWFAWLATFGTLLPTTGDPEPVARSTSAKATVAKFTGVDRARWNESNGPTFVGAFLRPGQRLDLAAGLAEVTYDCGARVLIHGPATFHVLGEKSGYLKLGKLVAAVTRPAAHGFAIQTPSCRVVDLGTEFGLDVAAAGTNRVAVFQGKVQLTPTGPNGEPVEIHSGQTLTLLADGGPPTWSDASPVEFVRRIVPRTLPDLDEARILAEEDFDHLSGGPYPSGTIDVHGQGGWVVAAGNSGARVRNDFHPGSLRNNAIYVHVNGVYAYRYDGRAYVAKAAVAPTVILQFTGRAGRGRYSRFGVAKFDGAQVNPGLYFGSQGDHWTVLLGSGATPGIELATSRDGFPSGSEYHDLRLTIDLATRVAVFQHKPAGGRWTTPSGLGAIDVSALDATAADGRNPWNWNSLYLRSIAIGDMFDNLSVSLRGGDIVEPGPRGAEIPPAASATKQPTSKQGPTSPDVGATRAARPTQIK